MKIPLPEDDAALAGREFERHLTPADAAAQSRPVGLVRPPDRRRTEWRRACCAGLGLLGPGAAGSPRCHCSGWTAGRDLATPEGETFFSSLARERTAQSAGVMSQETRVLGAIRRGLRRGPSRPIRPLLCGTGSRAIRGISFPPEAASLVPNRSRYSSRSRGEYGHGGPRDRISPRPGCGRGLSRGSELAAEIVAAPHRELQAIPWSERPLLRVRDGRAAPIDTVSVQQAYRRDRRDGDPAVAVRAGAADHA